MTARTADAPELKTCPHYLPVGCWCAQCSAEAERLRAVEALRVERWHATYNAALTGMYAGNEDWSGDPSDMHHMHKTAVIAADLAHGPLVKP